MYIYIYIYIFRGGDLGLNCSLIPLLNVIINSHLSYYTTIHLDAKFQLLGICCSRLYLKETISFFSSGPNWAHFGEFGGNTSNKECQIEIFWPQVVLIVVQMSFKVFWWTRILTETERTKSLSFWSNFDHSLPPEDGGNQK